MFKPYIKQDITFWEQAQQVIDLEQTMHWYLLAVHAARTTFKTTKRNTIKPVLNGYLRDHKFI
jgi:hypothetical protein